MKSEVFNIDCVKGMEQYPDKYFDLAIVDVPYGIKEDGRNNHTRSKLAKAKDYRNRSQYDNAAPDETYFRELLRVSKNQIIFGANHFISKIPFDSPCWLVWDKDNGDNDFADCELAYTSFKTALRKIKYRWAGMLQADMKNKQNRIHPNEKPIPLYRKILELYAKDGDKVLDTHMGSQASRIACYQMGYEYVGFEIDPDYFKDGCARFDLITSQQQLFRA